VHGAMTMLSTTVFSAIATPGSERADDAPASPSGEVTTLSSDLALIVGVVVGGMALFAAVFVIAVVVVKRRRSQASAKRAHTGTNDGNGDESLPKANGDIGNASESVSKSTSSGNYVDPSAVRAPCDGFVLNPEQGRATSIPGYEGARSPLVS
jgi:hypothetical protein